MSEDLAFNISYPVVEITCAEAGCTKAILRGCGAVHRRHTGDATLTVVGTIQAIQQIASEIIPGWPVTPEKLHACAACGEEFLPTDMKNVEYCPPCVRNGWKALQSPTLAAAELDAEPVGATVMAGGFADGARNERHEWWKLPTGRWDSRSTYACRTNGEPGVSSAWLADNRQPKRLT